MTAVAFAGGNDASRPAVVAPDASRAAGETRRLCAWCEQPIPDRARRDAVCCSKRCRQARHRFTRAAGSPAVTDAGGPLRLAYADPPYPGKAWLYRGHPDYAGEVDHAALIARLTGYDGWALSTSAAALPAVLALCPAGVRVAAWHRGERPTVSRWPLNAWEPVIYHGGRPAEPSRVDQPLQTRRVDSLVHGIAPMTTLPGRVIGAKPAAFCRWLFDLLGAAPGDQFDDLFPGSGAVGRAWAAYTAGQPSPAAVRDASDPDEPDASRPAAARHDASLEVLDDASDPARADASRRDRGATPAIARLACTEGVAA
ncbi:hypothetical protein [Actinoplanes subtropicus]|uniref:hypothetical protein n=1 Tax=Actinoplanes subtropicus TaxID=543632 RepID=UPI00068F5906|nr:hypothetical protein [Actinoplanes subtropicus]